MLDRASFRFLRQFRERAGGPIGRYSFALEVDCLLSQVGTGERPRGHDDLAQPGGFSDLRSRAHDRQQSVDDFHALRFGHRPAVGDRSPF
jgi:hypothetical protein